MVLTGNHNPLLEQKVGIYIGNRYVYNPFFDTPIEPFGFMTLRWFFDGSSSACGYLDVKVSTFTGYRALITQYMQHTLLIGKYGNSAVNYDFITDFSGNLVHVYILCNYWAPSISGSEMWLCLLFVIISLKRLLGWWRFHIGVQKHYLPRPHRL